MSKRQFKSQASSSRAIPTTGFGAFGTTTSASTLSYLAETPNLQPITDPNVVVAFKNLSKRDATTKSKALDDLRAYVREHPFDTTGGPEDAVLEAWVKVYPRTSIENSRRVRELAHLIQIELLKAARKRMEKHLPQIVGSWLAGTYDRDRGVARAANDGVRSLLDTQVKVTAFWTRYQPQILEYAKESFNETPKTLSDERTVTEDEMQEKYFRVMNSSISLVMNLVSHVSQTEIDKHQDDYSEFLSDNKTLWALAASKDASTRRSVHQLLLVTLNKQPDIVDVKFEKVISQSFITEGLVVAQSGSAFSLVQSLLKMTRLRSAIWTSSYKGKGSPLTRLSRFIEKGSQGGPADFWPAFRALILDLPHDISYTDITLTNKFLESIRQGISCREEPRANQLPAWSAYLDICEYVAGRLPIPEGSIKLLDQSILPAFEHFLSISSSWTISGINNLARAYRICEDLSTKDILVKAHVLESWQSFGERLKTQLQTSLPEQSKDFQKSQTSVATQSQRWFELIGAITREGAASDNLIINEPSEVILSTAINVMKSRNGKPFSAAATIDSALRLAPDYVSKSDTLSRIEAVLKYDLQDLILTPSAKYLVPALFRLRSFEGKQSTFESIWSTTIHHLLSSQLGQSQLEAINLLLADTELSDLVQSDAQLQEFFLQSFKAALQGDHDRWILLEALPRYGNLGGDVAQSVLKHAINNLDVDSTYLQGAFRTLEILSQQPAVFEAQDFHVAIITKLLALTELSDSTIAPRAAALRLVVDKSNAFEGTLPNKASSTFHVVQRNLEITNSQSLSIVTLVDQATALIATIDEPQEAVALLSNATVWRRELDQLLQTKPHAALAVMRPFAGAVYLTNSDSQVSSLTTAYDVNGYSGPFRNALYSTALLSSSVFKILGRVKQVEILRLLCLTMEVANDQLDLSQNSGIFQLQRDLNTTIEIREFITDLQNALATIADESRSWRRNPGDAIIDTHDSSATAHELLQALLKGAHGDSPLSYYSAKALNRWITKLIDAHGWLNEGADEWLTKTDVLKSSTTDHLAAVGLLTGVGEDLDSSKLISTLCNRLVSDIAGAKIDSPKTLALVVLLNSVIGVYDDGDVPVAQNRLVFAVKQILSWSTDLPNTNPQLTSEALRALQKLLPCIKEMYGSHWSDAIDLCNAVLTTASHDTVLSETNIPMVGMALKLVSILQSLHDTNDDVIESLAEHEKATASNLLALLQLRRTNDSQPLAFVDSTLSRLISKIPSKNVGDLSELYPLVASDFSEVQSSAYELLSRALPEVQQEISVNVLLEKTDATLPEELLSLLLEAPLFANFSDEDLAEFPSSIRGYLLTWHLVYSAFSTASFKVRNDYIENLKTENYITPLLDFLFHALGHSVGKPLNIDQARFAEDEIKNYRLSNASPDRDMQWLLVNIYYQALEYTPNLVKSWWLNCKSKTTRLAVETWTQKYFTTFVIQGVLDQVSEWADNQEPGTDTEKQLDVKVLRKAREIRAGYEVDETEAEIVIKFGATYPLEGIKVEGLRRVAASEKKWLSWMMIIQGAITFANGSITDGLITFRKNVAGALEGHSECAICYSIISPTKKIPNKRCMTCKNLFHSDCLFKWFSTSNQNTCPLCRNPFQYM